MKAIFDSYPDRLVKRTHENILDALMWIKKELLRTQSPVIALMCLTEVIEAVADLMNHSEEDINSHLADINENIDEDEVKKYILDGTGSRLFSNHTVWDVLSYSYYFFSMQYVIFKHMFTALGKSAEKEAGQNINLDAYERTLNLFGSFYSTEFMSAQHFEFKIVAIEGKLESLYTIQSSVSLLVFEVAHLIENNSPISKCKNCNNFFVSTGRSDIIYCDYPSPQDPDKKCSEIGAQIARAEKEKNDKATRLYRKIYMRNKMLEKRNPEETKYTVILRELVDGSKRWRRIIKENPDRQNEYLAWIQSYDRKEV